MPKKYKHIDTKLVHAGEPDPKIDGAVAMPIFQTAMFETYGDADYHDVRYIRLNNTPNHAALHAKLAALENAEAALVTSSGMAAITGAIMTTVGVGEHILVQNSLYGGTHNFVTKDLPRMGVEYDFIDPDDPGSWETKLKPNTKAIYVEAISNPVMLVGDLTAAVDFAKAHALVSMIDNTFPSPYNFRPIEHGFDLSLHSGTKYMNGHTDIVAGAVIGRKGLVTDIKYKVDHLGGTLDPHACYMLQRGLKTLALRMRHQNASAQKIAEYLEAHSRVDKVNYPGLPSHPAHERAQSALRRLQRHAQLRTVRWRASGGQVFAQRGDSDHRAEPRRCRDTSDRARTHITRRHVARRPPVRRHNGHVDSHVGRHRGDRRHHRGFSTRL